MSDSIGRSGRRAGHPHHRHARGHEPTGDIFGGWLIVEMYLAAGDATARRDRGRCAIVAPDSMVFHWAVFVWDEVSLYAEIVRVGRRSLSIVSEAWRRSRGSDDCFKVPQATFTFVAIDEMRRPREVPPAP